MTARYLSAITGTQLTKSDIDEQLLTAEAFIDDPLWCKHTAKNLGLDELRLEAPPGAKTIHVRLDVRGITEPLLDARIPSLAVATRRYRRKDGIAIYAKDRSWRIVLAPGQPVSYLPEPGTDPEDSTRPMTWDAIDALAAENGTLASLFPEREH
jgi:hypothetical protein